MKEKHPYSMDARLQQRLQGVSAPVPEGLWDRIADARQQRRGPTMGWLGFAALVLVTASWAGWLTYAESPAPAQPVIPEEIRIAASAGDPATPAMEVELSTADGVATAATTYDTDRTAGADEENQKERLAVAKTPVHVSRRAQQGRAAAATHPGLSGNEVLLEGRRSGLTHLLHEQGVRNTDEDTPAFRASEGAAADLPALPGTLREWSAPSSIQAGESRELPLWAGSAQAILRGPSCYSFNSFLRGLSVDAYLAPEYAARQLVYKDEGVIDYAAQRKATESYMFAFSMGLRANAHFEGGLAFRTGIIYTDIVEKLRYKDPDAEVRRVITLNVDTIFSPPDILILVDTLSIVEYGRQEKIEYNRYRFYDVPFIIGYEIDRGPLILHFNTGIMVNIGTSRRGSVLDADANLVSINSRNGGYPAFRKKVGSSLLMSLGINYAIRPKLHLLVEPQLRVWLQPLNVQEYPIDQKYVNLGLAMGVRKYF